MPTLAPSRPSARLAGLTRRLVAVAVALLLPTVGAVAQGRGATSSAAPTGAARTTAAAPERTVTSATFDATREELRQALAGFERSNARGAASEAMAIRQRLEQGDFKVGDRILLSFTVDSTVQRELTVRDSLVVDLPPLASLSLRGVLRRELNTAFAQHLRRYYREPQVRVTSLMRVGAIGAVAKPGYYQVPSEVTLSDVMGVAGGLSPTANPKKVELWRGQTRLMDYRAITSSTRDGKTLGELGVQPGDEVRVAERSQRNLTNLLWVGTMVVSTLVSVVFLVRSANNY
jgi:protein involved in polysaccharide export with SLBB domain